MHWTKKDQMSQTSSWMVSWEACTDAMRCLKFSCQHWIAKHTEGMCRIRKLLAIWQGGDLDVCPQCLALEDARHVWHCLAEGATTVCTAGFEKLLQWMMAEDADPEIHQAILLTRLTQHFNQHPLTPIDTHLDGTKVAILSQDEIGWANFFKGCIMQDWEQCK